MLDVQNLGWYAVYVRSRHEKKVHQLFQEQGLTSFLPLLETWKQWSDRKKKVSDPLFRGYVFVNIDLFKDRIKVLDTEGVVPTAHAVPMENSFREDIAFSSIGLEKALANAPDRAGSFFAVPKVIE